MTNCDNQIFSSGLFSDQNIVVTGGGSGIGRMIALDIAKLGGTPILLGRRQELLDETQSIIAKMGGDSAAYAVNIRDEELVDQTFERIVTNHERIHGLVNNAGGQFPALAEDMSTKGWRAVIDLNLNGTFYVTTAAYRHSLKDHGGSVVSITVNNWNGYPHMSHTGAARAGVTNLTKTLALEWAHRGVRVNAVAPGVIQSSGIDTYDLEKQESISRQAQGAPARRFGTTSEVSAPTLFLLSPGAAFITGAILKVDGGMSLSPVPLAPIPTGRPFNEFHSPALFEDIE